LRPERPRGWKDGLDALLPFLFGPAAVVQDGDEEAFGFARAGAGGDDVVLGRLVFCGQPAPGSVLADKGVERGLDVERRIDARRRGSE